MSETKEVYDFLTAKTIDVSGVRIFYTDSKAVGKRISPPLMMSVQQLLNAISDARFTLETVQEAIDNMETLIQKAYEKEYSGE